MQLRLLGGEPERFQAVVISVAKVVDGSGHVWGRCMRAICSTFKMFGMVSTELPTQ